MFSKKNEIEAEHIEEEAELSETEKDTEEEQQEPALRREDFNARSVSYIGPGLQLTGEVVVDEGLVVEGFVEGNIETTDQSLTVGRQGRVSGNILANNAEIRGKVTGEIYGRELVRLFPSAVVEGKIFCKRLVMDDGATFNGNIDMTWDGVAAEKEEKDEPKGADKKAGAKKKASGESSEKVRLTSVDKEEPVAKAAS